MDKLIKVELSVASIELIHSALMYYTVNGGSQWAGEERRNNRRLRAKTLSTGFAELLGGNWSIDEDGTGDTVEIIND